MVAGEERKVLEKVAEQLCAELGYREEDDPDDEVPDGRTARGALFGSLGTEDEWLIAAARRGLERIAVALWTKHPPIVPESVLRSLIDGAELVMRDGLAKGERPTAIMPGVVFLIAVPAIDQDEALALSKRTAELLEQGCQRRP